MIEAVVSGWQNYGGRLWLAVGIAAFSAVMLIDVGRLLGDVQVEGRPAFDASVFTRAHLPNQTEDLQQAISVWTKAEDDLRKTPPLHRAADRGPRFFVRTHASIDFILFTPAYCYLLWILLQRLSGSQRLARWIAASAFIFDEFENIATWFFVGGLSGTPKTLQLLGWLTLVKWVVLAVGAIAGIVLWRSSGKAALLMSTREHPLKVLSGLILLVGCFVALIALPAGGALEQLPDVVRFHLLQLDRSVIPYLSALALFLLALTVSVAGFLCQTPRIHLSALAPAARVMTSGKVLLVCAAFSALSWLISALSGHPSYTPTFVIFAIVVSLRLLAWIVGGGLVPADATDGAPPPPSYSISKRAAWVSALGGAIVVALGLAIVRAAFPPLIVGLNNPQVPWWLTTLIGAAIAAFGGVVFQATVIRRLRWARTRPWFETPSTLVVVVLTLLGATWLASYPSHAAYIGSLGSVCIGFGVLAVLIGLLKWASRRFAPWCVTQTLGLGRGTPWLTLLWISWAVASLANTEGLYHDTRVIQHSGKHRYSDLTDAFNQWITTQNSILQRCPSKAQQTLPMVFVATAGGGIRATYWTTGVLDELFGTRGDLCGPASSLFVISGASGGSVGAATWVAAVSSKLSPSKAANALANDTALPGVLAGLLLRDLPQPLIQGQWRDRAALLEDGWARSTQVFRTANNTAVGWTQLGDRLPWTPLLILNASSVNDGCRALVTNVGALPAVESAECGRLPTHPTSAGPVSSSFDPFSGLVNRAQAEGICDGSDVRATSPNVDLTAVTAMLLSARFPYVTPTGALVRCLKVTQGDTEPQSDTPKYAVSYVVDGGYYENSGILTILQIWSALKPLVTEYNRSAPVPVVPWLVIADNAYRSSANDSGRHRPLEVFAPLRANQNKTVFVDQQPLEQMAAVAFRAPGAIRCAPTSGCSQESASEDRILVIAPNQEATVAAPLGWVLSQVSRDDLSRQLCQKLQSSPAAQKLLGQLRQVPAADRLTSSCVG